MGLAIIMAVAAMAAAAASAAGVAGRMSDWIDRLGDVESKPSDGKWKAMRDAERNALRDRVNDFDK